jgi:hypothetical protein
MRPAFRFAALAAVAAICLTPVAASAWGSLGHRIIGELAILTLPKEVPAFLRSKHAAADMGELAREADRSKGSGRIHDTNRDSAHFVDVDDDGRILGGPKLVEIQATRAEYEAALQAAGTDSWKAGYLQYAIIDSYQQLVRDFAYWRVDVAAGKRAKGAKKAWYKRDQIRREALLMSNLGTLAHYVGDGAQPLHVTSHYNGWGDYPNPEGFTKDRVHQSIDGSPALSGVTRDVVLAGMPALRLCDCSIEKRVIDYLLASNALVTPLYRMIGEGAFKPGDARGATFSTGRLAVAAAELRDLIVMAWRESATVKVGYPQVSVADIESGKLADPWDSMIGKD